MFAWVKPHNKKQSFCFARYFLKLHENTKSDLFKVLDPSTCEVPKEAKSRDVVPVQHFIPSVDTICFIYDLNLLSCSIMMSENVVSFVH